MGLVKKSLTRVRLYKPPPQHWRGKREISVIFASAIIFADSALGLTVCQVLSAKLKLVLRQNPMGET